MPDSCSNPGCGVSMSRCPVCERHFVKQAQEVCASCSPWACENCGKEVKYAYKKTKSALEVAQEVTMLMGYGTTIGKCINCEQIKAVGDMHICRSCCLKKVDEHELVCQECLVEDGSSWTPDSRQEGECRDCGEERLLNEEFMCKSCYDKMHLSKLIVNSETSRCWNCHNVFVKQLYNQHFCPECLVSCYGCRGKFEPEDKTDIFCEECKARIHEGQCTSCYSYADNLNEQGHCYNCATPIGRSFCAACNVNEVAEAGELCPSCELRSKMCPRCLKNTITTAEYICSECKGND